MIKRISKLMAIVTLCLFVFVGQSMALDSTATQTVNFSIGEINSIVTHGNPGELILAQLQEGFPTFVPATDATTTYDVCTNNTGMKITGILNEAMPSMSEIRVGLAVPMVGNSNGCVYIGASSAVVLVDGITPVSSMNNTITYELHADVEAGVVSGERIVTLTLTPNI